MAGIRREDERMKIPALEHLSRLGYAYLPRNSFRRDRETCILPDSLREFLTRTQGADRAEELLEPLTADLRETLNRPDDGETFYRTVRDGWRGVPLIDFAHPERNLFQETTELRCGGGGGFRPDVTLFVNGLPLAMIELKTSDRGQGIRSEYDRMLARCRNAELRGILRAAQIWAFSTGEESDPARLMPTEGTYYAAAAEEDVSVYAFQADGTEPAGGLPPADPEEIRRIREDNGMPADVGRRRASFPGTPTHRMLTWLFRPERFLFLLRYGVRYERTENGMRRRLLTQEQVRALRSARDKARRGYRNWSFPPRGSAGEASLTASLIELMRDEIPGCRIYRIVPERKDVRRTDRALAAAGIRTARRSRPDAGDVTLAEMPGDPKAWLQEARERDFGGTRIMLIPPENGEYRTNRNPRTLLRAADPGAVLAEWPLPEPEEEPGYTYLLECADGTLYCGWTNDLEKRVRTHNEGRGAKYTRSRLPVKLVWYEKFDTREQAMSREWRLKRMSRAQKERLIREEGLPDGTAPRKEKE